MTINDLGTRHNEDIQTITDRVLAVEQEEAELVKTMGQTMDYKNSPAPLRFLDTPFFLVN